MDWVLLFLSHLEVKKVKCLYLYWIILSVIWAVLSRGPLNAILHGSSVTTGENRGTRRKPAMLGRVKLDNTPLTCDQDNFNQITARSRNRTLVSGERHLLYHWGTITPIYYIILRFNRKLLNLMKLIGNY